MTAFRLLGTAAVAALLAASLVACSPTIQGSHVRVGVVDAVTTLNAETPYGRASASNADIAYLTGSGFAYPGPDGDLLLDESFGTAEIVQEDPFIVRYTLSDGQRWSDGAALDAVDLLLAWAANSGALNDPDFDPTPFLNPETGRYGADYPAGTVYFDGRLAGGIEQAVTPPLVAGEHELLVRFESFLPGWRTVLAPGIPAHLLAERALGMEVDPRNTDSVAAAKAAVRAAIEGADRAALTALAGVWNHGFDLAESGFDPAIPAIGPYRLLEVDGAGGAVLTVNPEYTGMRQPVIETLRLRLSRDPLETAELLAKGELDLALPTPSEALIAALDGIAGVRTEVGVSARVEQLTLQFDGGRSGVFADPRIREAFLRTIPREQILDELLRPIAPGAERLDSFVVRESDPAYPATVSANGSAAYAGPDLARARQLLAEAGAGAPELCILFDPADPRRRATFDAVAGAAAEAGFVVEDCSRQDWESMLGVTGAYDAALFSWDSSRLGAEAVGRIFDSGSPVVNLNGFADPEADSIVAALRRAEESDERRRLLGELDARVWASAYGLPLYTHPTVTAVSERIVGVERSPLARGVFWNAWEWSPAR